MRKPILWILLVLLFGCEVSDETKMKDTRAAFDKIQFDQRVSEHIAAFNTLNELLISNQDSILEYNRLKHIGTHHKSRTQDLLIFENTVDQTLPPDIASKIKMIWNKLPPAMIQATTIYPDGDIIYSIRPEKIEDKPGSYSVQHKLIYGKRKSTNSQLHSVLDVLSKEMSIGQFQYYIKVEPYNGW